MGTIVDINTRRVLKLADEAAASEKPAPGMEAIALIACGGCNRNDFQLAQDKRIICPNCRMVIGPIRWYDITQPGGSSIA